MKIAAFGVCTAVVLIGLLMMLSWSKKRLDWYAPVTGAKLTVDGVGSQSVRLFKSSYASFALFPDRMMVLILGSSGQKQTYVILGPGPGHLSEGFKGSIRRCESAFFATPLFGFADDRAACRTPAPNRDGTREAKFDNRFVEFTADDGKRVRAEW